MNWKRGVQRHKRLFCALAASQSEGRQLCGHQLLSSHESRASDRRYHVVGIPLTAAYKSHTVSRIEPQRDV